MRSTPSRLHSFVRELRQRHVFPVAAGYAAAAFVLLQAADLLVPALHLPEWTLTAVVVLALLGFPVALALAWIFELTPDGLRRTDAPQGTTSPVVVRLTHARLAALAVLLLALGGAGFAAVARIRASASVPERTLAVLPFGNRAAGEGEDYFADGITEDILTNLAKIGELRVVSRTSVMPYRNTSKSVRQIGEELGVSYVLLGSVRRDGQRLRITAQLVNARTDDHVWAENYDRELGGVFAVQGEIAEEIARALRTRLTRAERQRIEAVPTRSQEAYDYYLRGKDYMNRYRKEENEIGIDFARRAIAADSSFAPGHALLALGFMNRVDKYGFERTWTDSALAAARRAVQLDPELAQAHGALASAHLVAGRYPEARAAFERAAALDPSNGAFTANLGVLNGLAGRHAEAAKWFRRALLIDRSRAMAAHYNLANAYAEIGLLAEAEAELEQVLALQPDVTVARSFAVALALQQGRTREAVAKADEIVLTNPTDASAWAYAGEAHLIAGGADEARSHFEKAFSLSPTAAGYVGSAAVHLAELLVRGGERGRASEVLDAYESAARAELDRGSRDPALRFNMAGVQAVRGNHAEALRWLADVLESSGYHPWKIQANPAIARLRDEPRFRQLVAKAKARTEEMRRQALAELPAVR